MLTRSGSNKMKKYKFGIRSAFQNTKYASCCFDFFAEQVRDIVE